MHRRVAPQTSLGPVASHITGSLVASAAMRVRFSRKKSRARRKKPPPFLKAGPTPRPALPMLLCASGRGLVLPLPRRERAGMRVIGCRFFGSAQVDPRLREGDGHSPYVNVFNGMLTHQPRKRLPDCERRVADWRSPVDYPHPRAGPCSPAPHRLSPFREYGPSRYRQSRCS